MFSADARAPVALDERLYAYLLAHQPPEHPELRELRRVTSALPRGRMQIASEQGHFLSFLVRLSGARRILEIGTFTGYSALTMALATPADGHIVTCDINDDWVDIGRKSWDRAGVNGKIQTRIGPALATLKQLLAEGTKDKFDLAFIDADKECLDAYYELAIQLVKQGGAIVLDNTLHRGRVADPNNIEQSTDFVRHLNTKVARDERVDRVILPIGDGMTLVRRR